MHCIHQELQPFKLALKGREAFDIRKFSSISYNFIDVLDHHGCYDF